MLAVVVDDDREAARACSLLIEAYTDLSAVTATTGAEGLRLLLHGRADVLVLDVQLPDMDGLDLLAQLRTAGIEVPCIVTTGFGSVARAVRALKLGAREFFEKPYRPEELLNAVTLACPDIRSDLPETAIRHSKRSGHTEPLDPRVSEAMREIERTATSQDGLGVRTVANRVGLSVSRLRQLFKMQVGRSPVRVRNDQRVKVAAIRLLHTTERVSEIAYGVGMQPATFDRLFRRAYGLSPTEYRRRFSASSEPWS